jgi:hypothetical protein
MAPNSTVNRVFILPASFDALELLPRSLHKFADDARYLASSILRKTARGQADDYGYVPLKAEYLIQIISERKCKEIVESLLAAEAIHRTPYQVGVRSFAYRLDDRYQADPHIRLPIESKRLLRNLERHSAICREEATRRMKPVHHTLARLQNDLQIDGAESKAILTTLPAKSNRFDVQGVLIRDILDRRFRLSVGNYGRVANSITSLKREIRSALRSSGTPLAGVDISCAQPCLLSLLIRICQENVGSYIGTPWLPLLPPVAPCSSVALFAAVCLSGSLYAVLECRLRDAGYIWTRDEVKKRFLTDVLAKKKASTAGAEYPSAIENVFKAEFPGVWKFIRDVNEDGWEHARLIRLLQQLESWLVIEQVCVRFVQQYPGEFLISLHDAVYCRPEMLGALTDSFEQVFSELDFRPTLKVEGCIRHDR